MTSLTIEAFVLLGLGICIIAIRSYARITTVGFRGLKPDDFIMVAAGAVYVCETMAAYMVDVRWDGLANSGMTDEQRKNLDPKSHEYAMRVGGSKTQLIGWSMYTLLLWTLKLSMNIFYERLTYGVENSRKRIRISLLLVGITYIATILSILLGCHPFSKNWQIYPNPGNNCQPAISKITIYVTVVLNVSTDIFLMSIPTPMLWKANLPARQKYFLLVMFSCGIFVMMAGILRCALILHDPFKGAQAAGAWAVRETFISVVIGNMPMIYPLLRKCFMNTFPAFSSQRSEFRGYDRDSEIHKMNKRKSAMRGVRSQGTTVTMTESEERIIGVAGGEGIAVTTETEVETRPRDEQVDGKATTEVSDGEGVYTAYVERGDITSGH